MARGLQYTDEPLKGIFNECLNDPLPQWELEGLQDLDFWVFVRYLSRRIYWATPAQPEAAPARESAPEATEEVSTESLLPTPKKRRKKASFILQGQVGEFGSSIHQFLPESTFAESVGASCLSAARLSTYLPKSNHDSANYSNNKLETNQAAAAKIATLQLSSYNQLIPCCSSSSTPSSSVHRAVRSLSSPLDTDLHFHPVRGPDVVLSNDRTVACTHFLDSSRTLMFSDRPVRVGETLYVEVGHLGLPYFGALLFGMTSCDPGTLSAGDLPADPEVLLDRKEYWVVYRGFPVPTAGDVLRFTFLPNGEVHHGVNGGARGRLLCVDSSQVLWAFFTLHGAVNRLRILGTVQASPPTSPSVSQGSTPDDSDSDLAFSVNRSSSASESSLVTAPSSPLSPPVSPTLSSSNAPLSSKISECTVCFDQEVDTVIYTCGHMCLCNDCGLRLKRQINACCPICRRPIKDVIKTYRP
ncbi:E3 ubiquitin-protein ligase NEURL1B-like [Chanodichthys erythropterus]|uniref:E3 ubiquitin-protein ligase NEURL1B-like n=1 Tax=Chanodichthys erythropterus TaxID=933992 RepID=UPI00351E26AA